MFHQKLCIRHDAWASVLLWWSFQLPVAHSCGLLSHPNHFHRGTFKLNAKVDADSLLYLLSHFECDKIWCKFIVLLSQVTLNAAATQYTCFLSSIYCPYWISQWSCHCSCKCIPVHSPWLPGYTDVTQTILVILTMAGLPDIPRISKAVTIKRLWGRSYNDDM